MRVPRWRMIIDPPVTSSPPNAFTPSRWALESRPFVELPPPFLCAIAESPSQSRIHAQSGGIRHAIGLDGLDANLGKVLPVSLQLLVLLLALEVKHENFVAAAVAHDFSCHFGRAGLDHTPRFARNRQYVAELDRL